MKKYLYLILILILLIGGFFAWQFFGRPKMDPNAPATYYKIFNDKEFLAGNEETAKEVDSKLDSRLKQYKKEFMTMAGTKDETKLKALFYMNFMQMYGYYYNRDLPVKKDFRHLLFNTRANNCESNTYIFSMLLEKAGYEYRTLSINKLSHGYVEVKIDGAWQIMDPTTNIWIDKSTEQLIADEKGNVKQFFLKSDDKENADAQKHLQRGLNVALLRDNMKKIGQGFDVQIDKYNYIDLKVFKY